MKTYSHETIQWVAKILSESVEATALILLTHDHPKHQKAQKVLAEDIEERIQRIQSWNPQRHSYGQLLKLVDGLPRLVSSPIPNKRTCTQEKREEQSSRPTLVFTSEDMEIMSQLAQDTNQQKHENPQGNPQNRELNWILEVERNTGAIQGCLKRLQSLLFPSAEPDHAFPQTLRLSRK